MTMYVNYPDYVGYSVRTYFSRQPGEMLTCPMCGSALTKTKIPPSKNVSDDIAELSLYPFHDFSHLVTCEMCHWWYIRENWGFSEINSDYDYMAAGVARKWNLASQTPVFGMILAQIEQAQKASAPAALDVDAIKRCIAEVGHPIGEVVYVGSGQARNGRVGDLFLIKTELSWLIFVQQPSAGENTKSVEAIDILNGVIFRTGQPSGLIVTSTDLLVDKVIEAWAAEIFSKSKNPKATIAASEFHRESMKVRHLRENSHTYQVEFSDERIDLNIFGLETAQQVEPWSKLLVDAELYQPEQILPEVFGKMFAGGQKIRISPVPVSPSTDPNWTFDNKR